MKTWDQYNKNIRDLSEKKVDQDSDGDNDFRDVRIARMIASGVPKEVAIQKTEGKPYDEKGSKKKI